MKLDSRPGSPAQPVDDRAASARERSLLPRVLRGRDLVIPLCVLDVGLLWSYATEVYDVRVASARVALTALSVVLSWTLFWTGLGVVGVPRGVRALSGCWALLPWNGLLLSQLPYVGYLFVPIEVVVSVWLLRRQVAVPPTRAFVLVAAVRALVLIAVTAASWSLRHHFLR